VIGKRHGVLLVNVGTPEAPTVPAVRAFLREFLGDPKVIDLPAPARWLLLNLVILPFRPKYSAHAYQQVWTKDGSPLMIISKAQRDALAALLPEAEVVLGMQYGQPSLSSAREQFTAQGITDVTLVPMYPQYADATSGATIESWGALSPGAKVVPAFHTEAGFIDALAAHVQQTVAAANAEHVLFSFHGLPVRQIERVCGTADCAHSTGPCPALSATNARCYRAQCYATAAAVAQAAGVEQTSSVAFQSRIKGSKWIGPFTEEALVALAQKGLKRLVVACPSFVADCLETLEEIAQRGAATFKAAGGESLTLVPAVNSNEVFLSGLASVIRAQLKVDAAA
jgi:ferrochelatase